MERRELQGGTALVGLEVVVLLVTPLLFVLVALAPWQKRTWETVKKDRGAAEPKTARWGQRVSERLLGSF